MSTADEKPKPVRDLITRGSKEPTPLGKAVFVGLRALDPLWQYQLLATGVGATVLRTLQGNAISQALVASTGVSFIDQLQLSPHRLLLLGMSIGSMLKQNFWITYISGDPMPAGPAASVAVFNWIFNSASTLLFLNKFTSTANIGETLTSTPVLLGTGLYIVGITLETLSELQRKWFKDDPKNKGKAYTGGLWTYARHINYCGYMFWRAGYALVGGGWAFGALVAALFFYDFNSRAIPVLDEYCTKRYGEQWAQYKKKTPSQFLPGIY